MMFIRQGAPGKPQKLTIGLLFTLLSHRRKVCHASGETESFDHRKKDRVEYDRPDPNMQAWWRPH